MLCEHRAEVLGRQDDLAGGTLMIAAVGPDGCNIPSKAHDRARRPATERGNGRCPRRRIARKGHRLGH